MFGESEPGRGGAQGAGGGAPRLLEKVSWARRPVGWRETCGRGRAEGVSMRATGREHLRCVWGHVASRTAAGPGGWPWF